MNIKKFNEKLSVILNEDEELVNADKVLSDAAERFDSIKAKVQDDLQNVSIGKETDAYTLDRIRSCIHYLSQAILIFNDTRQEPEGRLLRINRELDDATKALK